MSDEPKELKIEGKVLDSSSKPRKITKSGSSIGVLFPKRWFKRFLGAWGFVDIELGWDIEKKRRVIVISKSEKKENEK